MTKTRNNNCKRHKPFVSVPSLLRHPLMKTVPVPFSYPMKDVWVKKLRTEMEASMSTQGEKT